MHPNFEHVTECMKCNREPTFSTPLIQQPWLFSWFWKRKQKISSPHLTSLSTTEKFLQVNTILYSVQLSLLLLLATDQWEFKALNSLCRAMVSSSAQDHEALLFTFFCVAIYLSIHVVCYLSPCPTTQITHPDTINQLAHRAAPFTLWIV